MLIPPFFRYFLPSFSKAFTFLFSLCFILSDVFNPAMTFIISSAPSSQIINPHPHPKNPSTEGGKKKKQTGTDLDLTLPVLQSSDELTLGFTESTMQSLHQQLLPLFEQLLKLKLIDTEAVTSH